MLYKSYYCTYHDKFASDQTLNSNAECNRDNTSYSCPFLFMYIYQKLWIFLAQDSIMKIKIYVRGDKREKFNHANRFISTYHDVWL